MINVAIDGPAGRGEKHNSKACSRKMGYICVDTGALYRAVGLKFTKRERIYRLMRRLKGCCRKQRWIFAFRAASSTFF